MQYPDAIQGALDYIEQNLKTEITAAELARRAHYSTCHYCRLFSSATGSSVAGYILKRRLDYALAEMAHGKKAIDAVLEYGFATYAGFYKAFVKIYGCSPRKYLAIYHTHEPRQPEVAAMATEKEMRSILQNWAINSSLPIGSIFTAKEGKALGNVWKVGDDYILKTGERDKLLKDLKIADTLQRQGFTASTAIRTKAGGDVTDSDPPFVLTCGLKGAPLPMEDRFGGNRGAYGEIYGKSIARLHRALKAIEGDILPDDADVYETVTNWAIPEVMKQNAQWNMGIGNGFFGDYAETFGALCHKLPRQLIHRDPNPGNILFDDGMVSGFIDFDLSEKNIRLWDVCYCATGILSEGGDWAYETWLEILRGILRGYNAENTLTTAEKQAVYYVLCSIQMICVVYFESREEFRELAKTNRRMLSFIVQSKEAIQGLV